MTLDTNLSGRMHEPYELRLLSCSMPNTSSGTAGIIRTSISQVSGRKVRPGVRYQRKNKEAGITPLTLAGNQVVIAGNFPKSVITRDGDYVQDLAITSLRGVPLLFRTLQ